MTSQDAIRILGLNPNFTSTELKKAYRTLSKKNHPDIIDSGSNEKFLQIKEAYELLSISRTNGSKILLTHGSIFTIIRNN